MSNLVVQYLRYKNMSLKSSHLALACVERLVAQRAIVADHALEHRNLQVQVLRESLHKAVLPRQFERRPTRGAILLQLGL